MKDGNRLITSENIASGGSLAGTENLVELKIDYYNELYGEFGTSQYISSDVLVLPTVIQSMTLGSKGNSSPPVQSKQN